MIIIEDKPTPFVSYPLINGPSRHHGPITEGPRAYRRRIERDNRFRMYVRSFTIDTRITNLTPWPNSMFLQPTPGQKPMEFPPLTAEEVRVSSRQFEKRVTP